MDISPRTLDELDFRDVLLALSRRCRTDQGRERALQRPFLDSAEAVTDSLARIEEAQSLALEQLSLPLEGAADVRAPLERAAKSGLLDPKELVACARTLFAFARTREALSERRQRVPRLWTIAERLPVLEPLASRVDRCFEAGGEISDRASPQLKEARDRVRGLHRHIKARLDALLHDERFLTHLREPYYSLRNGRYVVPVLSQHQAEVPGIVHNASQSGQTLFVEPEGMVSFGNELAIAQSVVADEERRVLQDLTDRIGREAPKILEGALALSELDEAEGAARLASELDTHAPLLCDPHTLALDGLRHPALVLAHREVVANDVRMEGDVRAMVISGPNAGGKTVTLKAVGLSALMLRAGLPVPAQAGSRLPLFRSVHSAVGDAQDLSQGLSTFSAHVLQLKEIVAAAEEGALLLIDEIAADTDPREGAALAIAVLEELITRGATVLVTTHLEEVKALTHVDRRFLNARVGFDSRRMAPTYRLQLGAAGASSALDVASRMGLSEGLIGRARALAKGSGGPLAQALAAAEEDRRRAESELQRARAAAEAAEAEQKALAQERQRLQAEQAELTRRHALRLQDEAEAASRELSAILSAARQDGSRAGAGSARAALSALQDSAAESARSAERALSALEGSSAPFTPEVGHEAYHRVLKRNVEVLELEADEALVSAGALKMRVDRTDLGSPRAEAPRSGFPEGGKKQAALKRAEASAPAPLAAANLRLDVRGLRADDAQREVEGFLDRAYRAGDPGVLILHGHGTGALRQTLREYLDRSPYVRMFRPGEPHEGGDGVTVVALRT